MPQQQMPPELGSYSVSTGLASVSIQPGSGLISKQPGAGHNTFANIVIHDLPPNSNTRLGTFSCDLAVFRQQDTRRFFHAATGDIISVISNGAGKPLYFYNHTTDNYGMRKRIRIYQENNLKDNIVITLLLFGCFYVLYWALPITTDKAPAVLAFVSAVVLPFLISEMNFRKHYKYIQWLRANCTPEMPPQAQAMSAGI